MPNQLRTLITQNTEFINQPVPDDFTDRGGMAEISGESSEILA
jgi:hypothetical protein